MIKDATIIAFIQKAKTGEVITANGNSVIEENDLVVVISKHKAFKDIDDILEKWWTKNLY